jgi:hypothetical protein
MNIGQKVKSSAEVRDHMIASLRSELVGPSPGYPFVQLNGEEILRPQDPPRYRYACGILFPRGVTYSGSLDATEDEAGIDAAEAVSSKVEPGETDDPIDTSGEDIAATDASADSTPDIDTEPDASSMFVPSTMGISFLADISGGLRIEASWGTYQKREIDGYPGVLGQQDPPKKQWKAEPWFRAPGKASLTLTRKEFETPRWRKELTASGSNSVLSLDIVSRAWGGKRLVTITLMNLSEKSKPVNEKCFFQCGFSVHPEVGSRIDPYPGRPESLQDPEERSLSLLYRHRPNYAIGHGCSADWKLEEGIVREVRTEVLPVFEQAPILPRETIEGVQLSMKMLSERPDSEVIDACTALAAAYRTWIEEREKEASSDPSLSSELKAAAKSHMDSCRECLARIEKGTGILQTNADAMEAFRLMNRAMVQQRDHYALSVGDRGWTEGPTGSHVPERPYVPPAYSDTKWRPFQLAFILMNVCAFVDPGHADRKTVDVIWFPTGGGKTEAYLGLAAFVILLRRLSESENAGVTVLMRYTLRLLTTQQFQRAASLICALECIRRRDPDKFGSVPISIGLWVGGAVTPNRHSDAIQEYSRLSREGGANPFIVLACPWCGVAMGPRAYGNNSRVFGYKLDKRDGADDRIQFRCEDPDCDFSSAEGLPLEVVDDGIYERPPTLIIGTVDKFAMMPWEPKSRFLFGIDNPEAGEPPSLIIQDELHLISGPLGSMVGHYETIVDEFSTNRATGIPAKIVASTATIARAAEQIQNVYARSSILFPPQGLVAGESFFAREGKETAGRTYVGVLATALSSHVTAQKVVLATLLQSVALADGPDAALDPYWTLMVYFNSLRELGRASTLVQADIREYLNSLWDRIGLMEGILPGQAKTMRRFINNFDELTSRLRSSDIPAILQKLFSERPSRDAVDLCYATNMIQVGLDVPRLSLMTIVGQPKGASEYIQASSRVGRGAGKPGLVVTNYNPFKPRDRSHFESFRSFHENAYRHVEPTSVTPFSIPVCERAIHALAVSVARFLFPELRNSPSRGIANRRADVVRIITDRVKLIAPGEVQRATTILNSFLDDWERRKPQFYGDMGGQQDDPLMWPAGKPIRPEIAFLRNVLRQTPSSMRNVDAECEAVPAPTYGSEGTS